MLVQKKTPYHPLCSRDQNTHRPHRQPQTQNFPRTFIGCGLHVSEVINLRRKDLNFDRLTIHIKQSTGSKDRIVMLPSLLIYELTNYRKTTSSVYLFPSNQGGKFTTRTAQEIFTQACTRAKIDKDVSFHILRHSFATYLLEQGTHDELIALGGKYAKMVEVQTGF
ncbi:MAG: tyrosine-type recombinase/integrase [Candidatus Absconditabacterales bacterium]|nr:tyrosine-type recombinase/integrase [Candidatus Absconditabacterales bacterium]